MAKRKKAPPPEPEQRQRLWQNGWGMSMTAFTLAPQLPHGTEPPAEGRTLIR